MRPDGPARPLEDQSDEFVVSADGGDVEPSQMKIGIILGEPCSSEELERYFGGEQPCSRWSLKDFQKMAT